MAVCLQCSVALPDGGRFCSSCGAPVDRSPSALTETSTPSEFPTAASPGGDRPLALFPERSRFVPGALLDKRYRIVGLLGRGGMGEVYRADDLKLGQPVALKFLPPGLERDPQRLERFLEEVRNARQVTHSNVCRVYDIDEVDGQHYLSMEYVDGEDLSSLLRRIGRLPKDKATQIARQICAGVQAAHDQGILHRDLKPANVMIDGRGRAKITDFGLAGPIQDSEIRSGTPAYMAPEQLAGKEVTVRSDIYALGLVLYELFTGKQAFAASSLTESVRLHSDATPLRPSSHVEGFDLTVEQAILRCLEKEPKDRPASALAVAGALPGGDALAAAMAAGETPSPEMVADAGDVGGLKPLVALTTLILTVAGLLAFAWVQDRVCLVGQIAPEKSAELLAADARAIATLAGYDAEPVDTVIGYAPDFEYLSYRRNHDLTEDVTTVRPSPLRFWHRQSPRHLVATPNVNGVSVDWSDPPLGIPGEIRVQLDPRGRLLVFQAVPPLWDRNGEPAARPDWSSLFARAGLAMETCRPVPPRWNPPQGTDDRRAWEGAYPDTPGSTVRIEAGSYRDHAVYFSVFPAWVDIDAVVPVSATAVLEFVVVLSLLVGAGLLARRNLRLGRADRRGAFRLAAGLFVAAMICWALWTNHVPGLSEFWLVFIPAVGIGLWWSLFVGYLLWLAAEPSLRRLWPELLISWTRLLDGRFRDPMVGRDLLIGMFAGVAITFLKLYVSWADSIPAVDFHPLELIGVRFALAEIFFYIVYSVNFGFALTTVLLILRILLRRRWLASLAWVAIFSVVTGATEPGLVAKSIAVLAAALAFFVLVRFGFLAYCIMSFFGSAGLTLTLDSSKPYIAQSVVVLSILVVVAVYGFYTSLGGRPIFSDKFLDVQAPSTT